ncbi:hypothetical protein [Aquimonas sp.]|uniref:hypothetical protein n=1 Tax=Aquimonas sp. TaxID=1872588 RepID=UPI0037BFA157
MRDGRGLAIVITFVVHVMILAWLLQAGQVRPRTEIEDHTLLVEWLPADPAPPALPPPLAIAPTSTRSSPPQRPPPRPELIEPALGNPDAGPDIEPWSATPQWQGRSLSSQIEGWARDGQDAQLAPSDPLNPRFRIPGREEAFVEGFHVREELSAADVVNIVGRFLGGGEGLTCEDLRRKMRSDISDAERRKLIHDERQICRRGQAGTYR